MEGGLRPFPRIERGLLLLAAATSLSLVHTALRNSLTLGSVLTVNSSLPELEVNNRRTLSCVI